MDNLQASSTKFTLPAKNILMSHSNLEPAKIKITASWQHVTLGAKLDEIVQYAHLECCVSNIISCNLFKSIEFENPTSLNFKFPKAEIHCPSLPPQ